MDRDDRVNKIYHRPSGDARIGASQKAEALQKLARMEARQVASEENMERAGESMIFNPLSMQRRFETLNKRAERAPDKHKTDQSENKENETDPSVIEKIAENYYKANPELHQKTLVTLYQEIHPEDSHDHILEKLQRIYKDHSLVDEAIDFLIETAQINEALKKKYIEIKETLHIQFGREIQAGRNIGARAREFSEKGLGSPTALRDLYREVTGNPRSPHKLFDELIKKFQFSDMKNIIDFILHSLGTDMKAKGPSIAREELLRLCDETRTMQAILGVFRFFYNRMQLIKKQFHKINLSVPSRLHFENLARLLMALLEERYLSSDKVLMQAFDLEIAQQIAAQIVVFSHYLDAMRQISPKLFKSQKHRHDLSTALIAVLDDLEEELSQDQESKDG